MKVPSPDLSAPTGWPSMKTCPATLPTRRWTPPLGGPPVSWATASAAMRLSASSLDSVRLAEYSSGTVDVPLPRTQRWTAPLTVVPFLLSVPHT